MTSRKPSPRPAAPLSGERLQKFMAHCGIASRRAAEELIEQGRVEVNGVIVTQLGTRVEPDDDEVRVDGERLTPQRKRVVILLNKPVGTLCALSDPESRPLIYGLVPKDLALRSVGRLDFNTEGVLLLTNDGDLGQRLGHPRYTVQRVYEARVRGVPTPETLAALTRGIRLEDGPARAESVEIVKQTEHNSWVRLTLVEGRYREVRRMLERVGHPVVRLRRVTYAGLSAKGMPPAAWRFLTDAEIEALAEKGHVGTFELPPDPRRKGEIKTERSRAPAPGDIEKPRVSRKGVRGAARFDQSLPPPDREARGPRGQVVNSTRAADSAASSARKPARGQGTGAPRGAGSAPPPPRGRRPAGDAPPPRGRRPAADAPAPRGRRPAGDAPAPRGRRPAGDAPAPRGRRPAGDAPSPRGRRPSGDGAPPPSRPTPSRPPRGDRR